jgi:hypothetical protein
LFRNKAQAAQVNIWPQTRNRQLLKLLIDINLTENKQKDQNPKEARKQTVQQFSYEMQKKLGFFHI